MTLHQVLANDMMAGRFNPSSFTHEDHIGVAFELLNQCEFLDAAAFFAKSIRSFATKAGAPEKFNTTITIAFLSIVAERIKSDQTLAHFLTENSDLLTKDLLLSWYSDAALNSDAARRRFVMPAPRESGP